MVENNQGTSKLRNFVTNDPRFFYWLLIALVSIPLISPLGLPIAISPLTKESFDYIEALPEGSIVLYQSVVPAVWSEIGASQIAIMKQLMKNNIKVVQYASVAESLISWQLTLEAVDLTGKVYGVDYVNLGLIAGEEAAVAALATSFRETVVANFEGTPIDDIPMLDGVNGAADFDLILNFEAGNKYMQWIRHWTKPFDVPQIVIPTGISAATAMPFVSSGDIQGMVQSQKGGAEYELLLGEPGTAIKSLDALSVALMYIFVLTVIGNIIMLSKRGNE